MLITNKLIFFSGVARHLAAIRDSPKTLPVSLVVSAIVLILGAMPAVNRCNVFAWDMLLLSGFVTFIVGIALARSGQRRLEKMLDRLVHRGTLSTVEPLADIKNYLEQKARWWQIRGGVVVAAGIFTVFLFRVASKNSIGSDSQPIGMNSKSSEFVVYHRRDRLSRNGSGTQTSG